MKTLDPHPGADYGEARAAVITPDVIVEEIDGNFEVRLDRQRTPQLTLSPAYREFLRQAQKGDGVRESMGNLPKRSEAGGIACQ